MKVVFFGNSEFAVKPLKYILKNGVKVLCIVTKKKYNNIKKNNKTKISPIKFIAKKFKIPLYQPENINSSCSIEYLKSFSADFFIVISYGCILSKNVIKIPKIVSLNIHPSLLPKYRGAAPIERAIMNGDSITGVTLLKVEEKTDSGSIYFRKKINIPKNINYIELSEILSDMSGKILFKGMIKIKNNILISKKQNHKISTYANKIISEDYHLSFKEKGVNIFNKIRALSYKKMCYVNFNNLKLGICRIEFFINKVKGKYGEIIRIDKKEGILVKCKDGYVIVKELKIPGKKQILAIDFINGNKIQEGMIFY